MFLSRCLWVDHNAIAFHLPEQLRLLQGLPSRYRCCFSIYAKYMQPRVPPKRVEVGLPNDDEVQTSAPLPSVGTLITSWLRTHAPPPTFGGLDCMSHRRCSLMIGHLVQSLWSFESGTAIS